MDIFEIVKDWLCKQSISFQVDACPAEEGRWGLFPLGRQSLRIREDVLGTVHCRARYSYLLKTPAVPGLDAAREMERLQLAAATAPPKLGDGSRFVAHDGKMTKSAGDGLAWYEIRLDAEREEIYE